MTIFAASVFDATVIYEGNELFKGQGAARGWAEKLAKPPELRSSAAPYSRTVVVAVPYFDGQVQALQVSTEVGAFAHNELSAPAVTSFPILLNEDSDEARRLT